MIHLENYHKIIAEIKPYKASLVAVSKMKPVEDILLLQKHGQIKFGENYVQELLEKQESISNVDWHFIGHLQSNKVKYVAPFISLIQGVDTLSLLHEINKQGEKANKIINCLLQIYIAKEETKFGFSYEEAEELLSGNKLIPLMNISLKGLMGLATVTDNEKEIREEFRTLRKYFDRHFKSESSILSMGMTTDYKIALEEGSTMVRIGSAIFGERGK